MPWANGASLDLEVGYLRRIADEIGRPWAGLTRLNKPWYPTVQACSLFMGGRVEQAAALAEMVLEHQRHNLEALLVLTAAQVELGLDRRARATAELLRERFPTVDVGAWLDGNPYRGRDMVDRWRSDLISAGAFVMERGELGA